MPNSTNAEDFLNFLAPDDIRIKGSRIGIETILYDYIHKHRTPEEIADTYRTITLADVYAVLFYYHTHKEEMDRYVAEWLDFGFKARQEQEKDPRFQALKAKAKAWREAHAQAQASQS